MRLKLTLFLLGMQLGFSQAINVNLNTYTVPQLVTQVLFSGGSGGAACVGTISNVTWSTGTNFGSNTGGQPDNGIGYFTNVNTTFPLANGVILSTGRATAAAGPNANTQNNGAFNWPGDAELFNYIAALGIDPQLNSYNNATILEFDFVPFANSMSFDFLFASEEYGTFQCSFSDAFAFFLQNTTQGTPITNLALVPNTNDPISVTTIRSDAYNTDCGSVNPNFFGVYNVVGPAITATNFNGHTIRMTASSPVVPGETYHIKLVIADRNDQNYDSAVFLAGGSFDIGELDIASDPITGGLPGFTLAEGTALCAGSPQNIVVGTLIPGATYNWFNGTTLVQSGPSNVLSVSAPGTYSVEVIAPGGCQIPVSNTFLVEVFPPLPAGTPLDLFNVGLNTIFNLSTNTPLILNGIPNSGDFAVSYYASLTDLQNQQNEITNINAYPSLSNGQTIYALIYDQFGTYPCLTIRTFTLNYAAVCPTITNPSSNQVLCEGGDPIVFGVTTSATVANSIKFVYFNAPQTGDAMYTGGTVLGTVTPAAGVATYDAGVLGTTGSLPNTPGTYYVYAVLNPTPSDATCRPNQLIQVVVNEGANAGTDGSVTICETNTATINLNTLILGQDPGGTWVRTTGTGGVFNAAAGSFTPTAGSTSSTFTYTVNGIPPCSNDSSVASVIINSQPDAGLDGQIQICETSVTAINLFSLISGEETGGTWVRTTGTGGVFNATAGTFTPGAGVTTSTFTYTIVGAAPCVDDSSVATVNVVSQPNAGTSGSVFICSNDPSTIDLSTVISGQQTGGVWTRTTGTGGVFNAAAGTFTLTVGATSSSFTYTISGVLPCGPSSSIASVNIVPQSNAGVDGATTVCETSTVAIDLFSLITGEQTGGTWTRTLGSGGVFNAAAGTFTPALGATSSIFTYTLTGTTPCANDSSEVVVTIQPQPQAGIDGGLTICNTSATVIDLFTLITGEQTGGTWTRTTGTGGTFNAALGTFTPSLTTTSSTFTYTVSGVAPCIADSSVATLTVNVQPTAGNDGSIAVCETSTAAVNLSSLITGEQTGGIWTRTTGTGGTFDALAETYTPAPGATTSTFTYTVNGVAPCGPDSSIATVSISVAPNAGNDGSLTVCQSSTPINLADIITGEQVGGSWIRTGGTGGTFNAAAGTFIPGFNATLSTFTYTVSGVAPCVFDSSIATVNPITAPAANTPTPYEVCDDNNDGVACTFVLSTKTPEITTNPNVQVSYHLTPTDAQTGFNPIASNQPFCNNDFDQQTIYIRVFDPLAPNCPTLTTLSLIVHPKPVASVVADYALCDDNTDGIALFNLNAVVTPQVLGSLPAGQHSVTYYTSQADALVPQNALTGTTSYASGSTTLWVRVENTATGCFDVISFNLVVNSLPLLPTAGFFPQFEVCETTAPLGFESFNLTTQIASILNGQTGVQVTFYPTLANAQNNTNAIANPTAYTNTIAFNQTIGVALRNTTTGCRIVTTMDLVVNPRPTPNVPTTPYAVCDDNQDGISTFDLNTLTPGLLLGSTTAYTISYHLTQVDAQTPLNAISLTQPFSNNDPFMQIIWVRAEDPNTGCFSVVAVTLEVEPAPIAPLSLPALSLCDTNANTQDGCMPVNLAQQTAAVLALQPLNANNYTVTYYTNAADASASPVGVNPIVNTSTFTVCNTATIWVRVQQTATGCFAVGSFTVTVNIPIVLNTPTLYALCDNDATPNNQFTSFDLVSFVGAVPGHTLAFYLNAGLTQPIANPSAFTNTIAANQTIYIQATNTTTGCRAVRTLTIRVLPVPTPRTDPPALAPLCDVTNPGDGLEVFDLTLNAAYILNGQANVSLHYYPSYADALADTNEILTPTAANVGANVWIRVESALNIDSFNAPCFVLVEQALTVNPLPSLVQPVADYQECDDDTDNITTFNLTAWGEANLLTGNTPPLSNYSLSFYTDAALTQLIANPTSYQNTSTPQTLYVVAVNSTTGCRSVAGTFTILVNPKPLATSPDPYETCDTDGTNDGLFSVDLTQYLATILTGQPDTDFSVSFHLTQNDAQNDVNAIANTSAYQASTGTLWIRVENNLTGCARVVPFNFLIERLPEPVIVTDTNSNVICVDFISGQVVRPLTLEVDNDVPGSYTYAWYLSTDLVNAIATGSSYTVNTADPDGDTRTYVVVMTSTSDLLCSQASASFDVIQSGQAVVPAGQIGYTVSNAFSDLQTITVTVDGHGTYQYSLDDGPRQDSPVFTDVPMGEHTITVWDTEGGLANSCDPLILTGVSIIDYPHYFTPNGDDINETWNIVGLSSQINAKIYIFDRQGKLLKQISPTAAGWDGTYNGALMPATDYWFLVEYFEGDIAKEFKSHFSLKR